MDEKISIVITCYNTPEYINRSVSSALNQSYSNKEIILVDDGSNKRTKKVLNKLSSKLNLFITQKNYGVSHARNRGIEASSGKYILVLDGDDYLEPNFCSKAINTFKQDSEIILVTCYARWFRNDIDYQIYKPAGGDIGSYLFKSSAIGNSIFEKQKWKDVGGYDEKMLKGWEDWEFFIRLHKNGGFTSVIPEVLFHYRKSIKSRTSIANNNKYELMQYIFLKHQDLYKANFDKTLFFLLGKIKTAENQKMKIKNSQNYKIGGILLSPFRRFKSIFNK